jgi:transcriptional regulator with XRE-family HTH domain
MLVCVSALPVPAVPVVPSAPVHLHAHDSGGGYRGTADARRRELADFLRSRRERVRPEQVGLPVTGRRRTPGLRREEVAAVAGVGVTWYTWLEQARNVSPSVQVLDAIARALLLDPHERTHLFLLADAAPARVEAPELSVSPEVRLLLERVEPFPAVVTNARYDLLAYNRVYRHVVSDLDAVPPEERNTLWLLFCHPVWRASSLDPEETGRRLVGQFRAAMAEHMGEPAWRCLLHRLRAASPDFAAWWEEHEVRHPERMLKTIVSPRAGVLRCQLTHLWLDQGLTQRMSLYTPADDATLQAVTRLLAEVTDPTDAAAP